MLEHLGKELALRLTIGGIEVSFNLVVVAVALAVGALLVVLGGWLRRGLPADPDAPLTRRAAFLAATMDLFERQLLGGVSPHLVRPILPFAVTLFFYVLFCNWVGILPIPYIVSPTQDLNVTLGLALLVYGLTHYYGIRSKGIARHLRGYLEPFPFLLPLNLVGDLGRTLSHGFRLFGNILGGAILIVVAPTVLARIFEVVPAIGTALGWVGRIPLTLGLNAWFGLAFGVIQAFVFTLLAVAYIQVTAD
ncbi:MAG: ATP synthase F0 sector subunit a [Candidatus Bipolaricaulis sibiricus]|uniref:ATP synthase subunit a n=1 Tax=Bipolaricaulis sibiricus TaxID=2501609 RepID=A0A410FTY5_BIPS1|nr:MAG: ATP synthase F0 sector subunit a [Candidatus Bipolaricaulis sibiricus]